ncbi:zf-HC2 domain-containing protein [Desulfobacula sp.]
MINHWTFRCKDVSDLISRSMDEKLSLRIRMGIKFHLMMCHLCLNYKNQLNLIRKAIVKLDDSKSMDNEITPLPDQARQKIKNHLKNSE